MIMAKRNPDLLVSFEYLKYSSFTSLNLIKPSKAIYRSLYLGLVTEHLKSSTFFENVNPLHEFIAAALKCFTNGNNALQQD